MVMSKAEILQISFQSDTITEPSNTMTGYSSNNFHGEPFMLTLNEPYIIRNIFITNIFRGIQIY